MKKILLAFIVPAAVYMIANNIVFVTSESIDKTLLWKVNGTPDNGDYVYTSISDKTVGNVNIVKQITCTEGQTITHQGRSFYCNGVFLGDAKEVAKNGAPLYATRDIGVVPVGKAWLTGTHKDSYDSRYFGLLNIKDMSKLYPLF